MRALFCLIGIFVLGRDLGLAAEPLRLPPADRQSQGRIETASDTFGPRAPLELAPGFTSSLWAAEPMLANPLSLSFDDRGRLFVAETHRHRTSVIDLRDYPELIERDLASRSGEDRTRLLQEAFGEQVAQLGVESDRVRLIEDADGDGRADRSTVFAAGTHAPSDGVAASVLARGNDVWLAQSPSLMRLTRDAGLPGPAKRQELLRGFGVHVGFAGHDLQGLILGPDGKLYFSMGDRGAQIETKEGRTLALPDTGAIFRCHPDGTQLEVVASGLRNPRDLAFDDFGNLFTIDGAAGQGDRARLIHVIEGGDSGWRLGYQHVSPAEVGPWMREGLWRPRFEHQPAYVLPAIDGIEPGPAGLAYFPGTGLTAGYRGQFFVAHWNEGSSGSSVRTYAVRAVGAGFALAESKPFVRGAIPTDVAFGSDGRLYFSDWVSAWPWPKSGRGRIHAVAAANPSVEDAAAAEDTRRQLTEGTANRSPAQLAMALAHPDQRVRLAAQFALAERGATSLPLFEAVAGDTTAPRLARVHAIWGLGQLASHVPAALNRFAALMADKDSEVRAQTAKVVGDTLRIEAFAVLRTALQDSVPRVAFFAAQSLGKLRRPDAIPALLGLLRKNDDQDAVLRHAVVVALARLGADPMLANTSQDASRAVRLGGLLTYRRLEDPAVASFLGDFDPGIVREAARAINDGPIPGALPALAALLDTAPLDDLALVNRALNAHFCLGQPENAEALAAFASRPHVPATLRAEALRHLAFWAKPPSRDRVTGLRGNLPPRDAAPARKALVEFLGRLNGGTPEAVQVATIEAVAELALPGTGHALWDVVYQASRPTVARIAALQALEKLDDLRLEVAAQHAARSDRLPLRLAAIPVLQRRHPAVALPLFGILASKGTAMEQRKIFAALAGIDDPRSDEMLLQGLRRFEAGEIPVAAQAELLEAAARRTTGPLADAVGRIQAAWQAGTDRIAPYRSSLEGGDREQGRRLFKRHSKMACLKCHEAGRGGSGAGPVLPSLGLTKSKEQVLESLVVAAAHRDLDVGQSLSRTELRDLMAFLTEAWSPDEP